MVGQHGVYCQSNRQVGLPAMDLQIVMKSLSDAKELVSSVMEELRLAREARPAAGAELTRTRLAEFILTKKEARPKPRPCLRNDELRMR